MKKLLLITVTVFFIQVCNAQNVTGPYFGQTPPGTTPQLFAPGILTQPGGIVAVTRIAFSPDGNECFFSGPTDWNFSSTRMYHTKCIDNVWSAHELVSFFPGYSCRQPFFSAMDTLYFCSNKRNDIADIWMVVQTSEGWGIPEILPDPINTSSYYEGMYTRAKDGTTYVESMRPGGKGSIDVWRIPKQQPGQPLKAENICAPVNTGADNNDPFISPDGKYMILGSDYNDLFVTFSKENGGWTSPVNLNLFCPGANTSGSQEYAPYITADGKYLFFNRIDNGEFYWVSTSNIESLKNINFPPYVKNEIPDQTAIKDSSFYYQIPDSIFIDDNGNNTLAYTAKLNNGNPLPSWLGFDSTAISFSGTPAEISTLSVKVTATDTAHASVSCIFQITVQSSTDVNQFEDGKIQIFPNPAKDEFTINLGSNQFFKAARIELFNLSGKLVLAEDLQNAVQKTIDISGFSNGLYLVNIIVDGRIAYKNKICLE